MRKLFFIAAGLLFILVVARVGLSFLFAPALIDGQQVTFKTTILSEPQEQHGLYTFAVSYSNGWGSQTIHITVNQDLSYGQAVTIAGNVRKRVINDKRIVYSIYFPTITPTQSVSEIPLRVSSLLRKRVQSIYERAVTKDEASLLLGIVLGVKGSFSQNLLQAFKITGVMHVIAASGMNVTLVAAFLVSLLGRYFKRQYVAFVTIVVLCAYCLLAGLQPSIVRATLMGGLGLVAQLYGRQYSGMYGLFLAGSVMLLLNPTLIADVGFQLSFASSLGILSLHPLAKKVSFVSDDIATTLSSQIATLPILLMTFGQYGVLSILVNALVLWTVAPLMILGGTSAIIGLMIQPLGSAIAIVSLPLLWYFEKIVLFFGNFNWTWSITSLPGVFVVGYYLIIVSLLWMMRIKHHEKIFTTE